MSAEPHTGRARRAAGLSPIDNLDAQADQASGEPHAMEPRWRERLIRAAPENFTRRASGAAARDGWCMPQGQ